MTLFKTLIVSLAVVTISCNSSLKTTSSDAGDQQNAEMMNKKMLEAGFLKGTVVYSAVEGDCPYTIDVDSDQHDYLLDPINLDEKYQKDGARVWFKFAGLRMMNRCEKANPVNITEIQDRM